MEIKSGRDNLSVTVYVPWDCLNCCSFCASKTEYSVHKSNELMVIEQLKKWNKTQIQEIVFTGGEPTFNVSKLGELIELVPNKDVYINTTLLKDTFDDFLNLIDTHSNIKGVNISRHTESYEKDIVHLRNIATDEQIAILATRNISLRINCVLHFSGFFETITKNNILARWDDIGPIISFRSDYRNTIWNNLHSFHTHEFKAVVKDDPILSHSFCDVCDSVITNDYIYHRGLQYTSFIKEDTLYVNDIIIFNDGTVGYDWDRESVYIDKVYNYFLNHDSKNFSVKSDIDKDKEDSSPEILLPEFDKEFEKALISGDLEKLLESLYTAVKPEKKENATSSKSYDSFCGLHRSC